MNIVNSSESNRNVLKTNVLGPIYMKLTGSVSVDPQFHGEVHKIQPPRRHFDSPSDDAVININHRRLRTHLTVTRVVEMVTIALMNYNGCSFRSSNPNSDDFYDVSQIQFHPKKSVWTAKVDFVSESHKHNFHIHVQLIEVSQKMDEQHSVSSCIGFNPCYNIDLHSIPPTQEEQIPFNKHVLIKSMQTAFTNISLDISKQIILHSLPIFPEGCKTNTFRSIYQLNARLKSGSFATVCRGTHRASKKCVAVKCIQRKQLTPAEDVAIFNEVDILCSIKHERICPIIDFFAEEECYFIVMEFMEGGDVFDRIGKLKSYNEEVARDLVFEMLTAIEYLHKNNIAHCDLKPKNLLLRSLDSDSCVVLADFGFASQVYSPNSLTKSCGTPYFVAPEILFGNGYDCKADMWSVGVILYALLSGSLPFLGTRHIDLFNSIRDGKFTFDDSIWDQVSIEAKSLVCHLLVTDPSLRYSASEALQSAWIMEDKKVLRQSSLLVTSDRIKTFNAKLALKSAILAIQSAVRWKNLSCTTSRMKRNESKNEDK